MKHIVFAVLFGMCAVSASAEETSGAVTGETSVVETSSSRWKLLESLTSGMFYNGRNGQFYAGATTQAYALDKNEYFTIGTGVITPTKYSGNAIPILGLDVNIGHAMMDNQNINKFVTSVFSDKKSYIQYFAVGAWGSREITEPNWDYGGYFGIKMPFSK